MTVGVLLETISSREITEWIAFCKLEQEGEEDEPDGEAQLRNELLTMPATVNQKSKFEAIMKEKNKR